MTWWLTYGGWIAAVLNAGITRRCLLRLMEYCPYPDMTADLRRFAEQAVAA